MKLFSNGIIGLLGLTFIFGNPANGCTSKEKIKIEVEKTNKFKRFDCAYNTLREDWQKPEHIIILRVGKKQYLYIDVNSKIQGEYYTSDYFISYVDDYYKSMDCTQEMKDLINTLKEKEKDGKDTSNNS